MDGSLRPLGGTYHGVLSLAGQQLEQLGQPVQCATQRVERLLLRHRAQRLSQFSLPLDAFCAGAAAENAQHKASIQLPPAPSRGPQRRALDPVAGHIHP